jgi:hypothetical protein
MHTALTWMPPFAAVILTERRMAHSETLGRAASTRRLRGDFGDGLDRLHTVRTRQRATRSEPTASRPCTAERLVADGGGDHGG